MARCTGTMKIGNHLRATRVFVRSAVPDRYFYRVPSRLPTTDDGSGRPLAEDRDSATPDSRERTDTAAPDQAGDHVAGDGSPAFARDSRAAAGSSTVQEKGTTEAGDA